MKQQTEEGTCKKNKKAGGREKKKEKKNWLRNQPGSLVCGWMDGWMGEGVSE